MSSASHGKTFTTRSQHVQLKRTTALRKMNSKKNKMRMTIRNKIKEGLTWARVEFDSKNEQGTCLGYFGCNGRDVVAGQVYIGKLWNNKRDRNGSWMKKFKGKSVCVLSNKLKAAMHHSGITLKVRNLIFSHYKKVDTLVEVIRNKQSNDLKKMSNVGKATVEKIYEAYERIKHIVEEIYELRENFPTLVKYLNDDQRSALTTWGFDRESPTIPLTGLILEDPWRIQYDTEFDKFNPKNVHGGGRDLFITATTSKSRSKMVECIVEDKLLSNEDPRAKRCDAIDRIRGYMKDSGSYWMPKDDFLIDEESIHPSWPIKTKGNYVALTKFAEIEDYIEERLKLTQKNFKEPSFIIHPSEYKHLDDDQQNAVYKACTNPVFILKGGAGVGKTTVCSHIIKSLGKYNVLCAAPTGKAAKRLSEITRHEAYTVSKLVFSFRNGPMKTPDILLLDEQSMQSTELLAQLLGKKVFKQIIFVGDVCQLRSISPGQCFKDLCDSEFPSVELKKIYRSDNYNIVFNSTLIRKGNHELLCDKETFIVKPYLNNEGVVECVQKIFRKTKQMPMVLCNTNKQVADMNFLLQDVFNPAREDERIICYTQPVNFGYDSDNLKWKYENWRYRLHDVVICTKNIYKQSESKLFLVVANGDMGKIIEINRCVKECPQKNKKSGKSGKSGKKDEAEAENVIVQFGNKCETRYETMNLKNELEKDILRPAYALTVHKAQGSESPFVIVLASASKMGRNRELLYTAVTRAKQKCIVFNDKNAIKRSVIEEPEKRITFLLE
jgi:exodeoxyribonuclease V alpha subunit